MSLVPVIKVAVDLTVFNTRVGQITLAAFLGERLNGVVSRIAPYVKELEK